MTSRGPSDGGAIQASQALLHCSCAGLRRHLSPRIIPPTNAPTVAPNNAAGAGTASGRSGLGNALRHIPILGGIVGGVGDVVSGVGNTALGIVSLGQSGTLGRGVGQIASGALNTVGKLWAMPNTAVGLHPKTRHVSTNDKALPSRGRHFLRGC